MDLSNINDFYMELSGSAEGRFEVDLGQRVDIPGGDIWEVGVKSFTFPCLWNSLGKLVPEVRLLYQSDLTRTEREFKGQRTGITIPPGAYTSAKDLINALQSQLTFVTIPDSKIADLRYLIQIDNICEKIYISYNYLNVEEGGYSDNIKEGVIFTPNVDFTIVYGLARAVANKRNQLKTDNSLTGRHTVQLPGLIQQINIECDLVENQFVFPKGDSRILFSSSNISKPKNGIMQTIAPANTISYKRITKSRIDLMTFEFRNQNEEIINFIETVRPFFQIDFATKVYLSLHFRRVNQPENNGSL